MTVGKVVIARVVENASTKLKRVADTWYYQLRLVGPTGKMRVQDNCVSAHNYALAEAEYWAELTGWPIVEQEVDNRKQQ